MMFTPNSTGAGKAASEIVEQYYGADVWVTEEDQEKHPSFVVVPAFTEVVVNDDNSTSEQIDAAVQEMLENGTNANMIRFEEGSVLDGSSNMEHMASFKYGYKLSAVRDWLYEQTKDSMQ